MLQFKIISFFFLFSFQHFNGIRRLLFSIIPLIFGLETWELPNTINIYSASCNQIKWPIVDLAFRNAVVITNAAQRRLTGIGLQFDEGLEGADEEKDRWSPAGETSVDEKVKGFRCVCALGWYRCSLFRGSARRCNSNIHDSLLTTINIWSIVHTKIFLVDNARYRLAAAVEITWVWSRTWRNCEMLSTGLSRISRDLNVNLQDYCNDKVWHVFVVK